MDDATLINGLLAKRVELVNLNSELRERMAIVSNDIEAVESVLESAILDEVAASMTRQR